MKNRILAGRHIQLVLHLVAWVIIILIPQYIFHFYGDDGTILLRAYLYISVYGLIFYVNYLLLVPHLFLKDKKGWYIAAAVFTIALSYFIIQAITVHYLPDATHDRIVEEILKKMANSDSNWRPPHKQFKVINYLFTSILLSGFGLGLAVVNRLTENEKQRKELEKQKLHSELAFLKNQVSPHFFFNTLNNIYALIGLDASTAQVSVHKLSKLMRYLLYESDNGQTRLSQEIDFMHNYIDLMRLRLNQKMDVKIDFPKDFIDIAMPPLLFISFIENAFKHGVSNRESSFVHIRMAIDENKIHFFCENSKLNHNSSSDLSNSGIGLENIKKRLSLLFPETHELKIENDDSVFKVELILTIKNLYV